MNKVQDEMLRQNSARIRELLGMQHLSQSDVSELLRLTRMGGQVPIADGFDGDGYPFWLAQTICGWMQSDALHIRSVGTAPDRQRTAQRGSVRSKSFNAKDGTFSATISTENEVLVMDPFSLQPVLEVLQSKGALVPSTFPFLRDHQQTTSAVIGQGFNPRRENTVWAADFKLAQTQAAREVGQLIGDGMIGGVSIGYFFGPKDFIDIPPGRTEIVNGQTHTNSSGETLRVVFRWQLRETSAVVFPADPAAQIRSNQYQQLNSERGNKMPALATTAIHSHNSATGRPTRGELVSALMVKGGVTDPSVCRAQYDFPSGRPIIRSQTPQFVRDAERGLALSYRDPLELVRMSAELDGVYFKDTSPSTVCSKLFAEAQVRFSTSNLSSVFSEAIASLILSRQSAAGDSTLGWCDEAEVETMKDLPAVQIAPVELTKQDRRGVAEQVSFETIEETTTQGQYTAMFKIDEQDFMDGRAGEIIRTIPKQLGDAANALRRKLVYGYMIRNPAMRDGDALFHANHGNLNTTSPLGGAGNFETARQAMQIHQQNGIDLNLNPAFLIVPPALVDTAEVMLASSALVIRQDGTQGPALATDSLLQNSWNDPYSGQAITGSATSWYLAAAGEHGLQVRYMKGTNRHPQIRTGFMKPGTGSFGFVTDIRYLMSVAAIGYRGISRSDT